MSGRVGRVQGRCILLTIPVEMVDFIDILRD